MIGFHLLMFKGLNFSKAIIRRAVMKSTPALSQSIPQFPFFKYEYWHRDCEIVSVEDNEVSICWSDSYQQKTQERSGLSKLLSKLTPDRVVRSIPEAKISQKSWQTNQMCCVSGAMLFCNG